MGRIKRHNVKDRINKKKAKKKKEKRSEEGD